MWCNVLDSWDYCFPFDPMSQDTENNHCINKWSKKIGHNLKALMKVLRFASHRGNSGFTLESLFLKEISLVYPLKDEIPSRKVDIHSMIPWCNLENDNEKLNFFDEESCRLFQPVITDLGMCHSFNPTPVLDVLKPSYFTESFNAAYEEDLPQNNTIHMGVNSGKTLDFYLLGGYHRKNMAIPDYENNMNDFGYVSYGDHVKTISKFLVGVSNSHHYIDMKAIGEKIKAGYHTTWKVQAMEIVPAHDLQDIPIEQRKCRFESEVMGLEVFKSYSQAICEFEFKTKKARDVCKCVPWYVPVN